MNFSYHFRRITNNSGQLSKYLSLQNQLPALRGQMLWRAKNLGIKQLDLIVGSWAQLNIHKLNIQQLKKFNQEVIRQETPDLTKKLLGQLQIQDHQEILKDIRNYAIDKSYDKTAFV